jgi:beta-phosphoglucomutase-like phosphatase (HAD superfamily)
MKNLIVFDLDGTVLDTEYEISAITVDILRDYGYELDTDTVFARYGGLSFSNKFNRIASDHGRSFTSEQLKAIRAVYDARKEALFNREGLAAVSGLPGLLTRLAVSMDNTLAIGSSNNTDRSALGLKSGGLSQYFNKRIYGPNLVGGRAKPDPALYVRAIKDNGFSPARTIVVDDSAPGIQAGHLAGAFVVAYLDPRFGAKREEKRTEFLAAGADAVISSYDEFESAVAKARPAWLARQLSI